MNRLANEKSPYLLQHAGNPVDWRPWGEEAFDAARAQDRPIFLSIGYSSCHWCHVMEGESFEDESVARLLNESYISIKVDREERPDIDAVYMKVCQAMTGSGGWPLTIFMTPDRRPFFAATYLPKSSRGGLIGMAELLPHIASIWKSDRAHLERVGENAFAALDASSLRGGGAAIPAGAIAEAARRLEASFDPEFGGFGDRPKFPTPHQLTLLLRARRRGGSEAALEMTTRTLRAIHDGGIHDHLGGGYHRYATDRRWLVPHFEKMLYDQAMLAIAFLETAQATGDRFFAGAAEDIFGYVLRDMNLPGGGFCSAEDADSEGGEGAFYIWKKDGIEAALGPGDSEIFCDFYGVTDGGIFEGKNILNIPRGAREAAGEISAANGTSARALDELLSRARRRLLDIRSLRPRPMRDDKVLADWNGLMIAALARGARVTGRPEYAEAARKAARFVLGAMRGPGGGLLHRWREGEGAIEGFLDDYAFMVYGLLELYEATFEPEHLSDALALTDLMIQRFGDGDGGGFFLTAGGAGDLPVRTKEIYDGAVPSGNSIAALCLLRLGRLTGRADYEARADRLLREFAGAMESHPTAYTQMLSAVDLALGPEAEIVIAGDPEADETKAMLAEIGRRFLPRAVTMLRPPGERPAIVDIAPMLGGMVPIDGDAAVYVCEGYSCKAPVVTHEDLADLLDGLEGT
ncbi:MAG: thioredoxin domain-containing protein [Candidatus Krumholzibacteria bacterium]|nr:thioredoxin domain-containing protein [Candidatus Krumholzibacteria bacterium]